MHVLRVLTACFVLAAGSARAQAEPAIWGTTPGGPTLRLVARAPTGIQPKSVSVSPDGRRVVVCNFGRPDRDNVAVYDAMTLARVGTVSFPGNAVESVFSPDGRTLYVSNFRRDRVEVIDFATLSVVDEIVVGSHPKTMVVSPDGGTLYVANYFGDSVSVVDLATRQELRRLATGERPRGMALLDDGTLLSAAFASNLVHAFEPTGAIELSRWNVCRYPRDILPSPGGETFWMTCSLGSIRGFHRDGGGRPFAVASAGRNPRSIGSSANGRYIGVANFGSNDLSLIDTVARTHRRIPVPDAGRLVGLAVHQGPFLRIYATDWDRREVILLVGPVVVPDRRP